MAEPRFPSESADWLGADEALERILRVARPLPEASVPLAESMGHILARDVVAPVSLPPWDNAAMDGYALRGWELDGMSPEGVSLLVAGEIRAGTPPQEPPPPGSAVRIMTGAPVPAGLDTVVRVEDTDLEGGEAGWVRILRARDQGGNVRSAGEDMAAGERLLAAGDPITPGRVAVLAAAGCDPVPVIRRPRVVILPTGDELRRPGDFQDVLDGIGIPESNGPALAAACRLVAAEARLLPPVPDQADALRRAVEAARGWGDVLVTLGGASMGTADLVKEVLAEMGFRLDFWRIRMRPGSPFSFGTLPRPGGTPLPVFGLPGNPASSFVTFQLLVRPFLLALGGEKEIHRPVVDAVAGIALPSHPERALFLRVTLEPDDAGPPVARPTGPQGSGLVRSLGDAQGLAVIPAGPPCPAGTPLRVLLLEDTRRGGVAAGYLDVLRTRGIS